MQRRRRHFSFHPFHARRVSHADAAPRTATDGRIRRELKLFNANTLSARRHAEIETRARGVAHEDDEKEPGLEGVTHRPRAGRRGRAIVDVRVQV